MTKVSIDAGNRLNECGLGNVLLNLFFGCHLCYRHGYTLNITPHTRLEKILSLKNTVNHNLPNFTIEETTAFSSNIPDIVADNSYRQYLWSQQLLETGISKDAVLVGNFFHSGLFMEDAVDYYCNFRTALMPDYDCLLHIRGDDFIGHLQHVYPQGINLSQDYYLKALELATYKLGNSIKVGILTDDPDYVRRCFPALNFYPILDGNESISWLYLKQCKNLIASNSSFSWTAGLFNKDFLVLPRNGYNLYGNDPTPYGFHIPGAYLC